MSMTKTEAIAVNTVCRALGIVDCQPNERPTEGAARAALRVLVDHSRHSLKAGVGVGDVDRWCDAGNILTGLQWRER